MMLILQNSLTQNGPLKISSALYFSQYNESITSFISPADSVGSSSAARPSNSHAYSMDNEMDGPQTEYINIQDDQNYENVKSPPKRPRSSKQSVQEDANNTQSYIEVSRYRITVRYFID